MKTDTILEVTLGKRGNGEAKTLQASWGDIHPDVQDRVIRYGFQRFVNDYVGGSDTTHDEKVKAAQERIAQMKDNTLPTRGSGGASVDPVTAEMRGILGRNLRKKAPDVWKRDFKSLDAKERGEALDAYMAKKDKAWNDKLREMAKGEVARKRKEREEEAKLSVGL